MTTASTTNTPTVAPSHVLPTCFAFSVSTYCASKTRVTEGASLADATTAAGTFGLRKCTRRIFEAWSDEPWVIDGAAVRVSLVCFSRAGDESVSGARLDGQPVDEIYTDLTARRDGTGVDLTGVRHLPENAGVAFMGDTKGGPFDVAGDQAHEWLRLPTNPNGRTNADVLKPWINGNGPDPATGGEVDRRLRVDDVRRRRGAVRRAAQRSSGEPPAAR